MPPPPPLRRCVLVTSLKMHEYIRAMRSRGGTRSIHTTFSGATRLTVASFLHADIKGLSKVRKCASAHVVDIW